MIATLVRLSYQIRATQFTKTSNTWTRPETRRVTRVVIDNQEAEFTIANNVLTLTQEPINCYLTKEAYISDTPLQLNIPETTYFTEFQPALEGFRGSVEELSDEITGEALQSETTLEIQNIDDLKFARLNNQQVDVWEYNRETEASRAVFQGRIKSVSTTNRGIRITIRNRISELDSQYELKSTENFPRAPRTELIPEYYGSVRNAKGINIQSKPVVLRETISLGLLSQTTDENSPFYKGRDDPYQYNSNTELTLLEEDKLYKITEDGREEIEFEYDFENTITVLSFENEQPDSIVIEQEQESPLHLNKNLQWILSGNEQREESFVTPEGQYGWDIGENRVEIGDEIEWDQPLPFPEYPRGTTIRRTSQVLNKIGNNIQFAQADRPIAGTALHFGGIGNVRIGDRQLAAEDYRTNYDGTVHRLEITNLLETGFRFSPVLFRQTPSLIDPYSGRVEIDVDIEPGDFFLFQFRQSGPVVGPPLREGTTRYLVVEVKEGTDSSDNEVKRIRFRPLEETQDDPSQFNQIRIIKGQIPGNSDELEFDCDNGVLGEIIRTPADMIAAIVENKDEESFRKSSRELGRISYELKSNKKRSQIVSEMNKSCNGLLYLDNQFRFKHRLFELQSPKASLDEINLFNIRSRGQTNDINQLVAKYRGLETVVTQQVAGDQIKSENRDIHLFFEKDVINIGNQILFYKSEFSTTFSFIHSGFLEVGLGDTVSIQSNVLNTEYGLGLITGVITRILKLKGNTEITINTAGQKGVRLATLQDDQSQPAVLDNIAEESHIVDNITESPLSREDYSGIGIIG